MVPSDPEEHVVSERLPPIMGAQRRARDVVADACLRWNLAHLVAPAALIVSELVANAAEHAHTFMTLEVAHRGSHLYLAVRDGTSTPPVQREPPPDMVVPGGRGLLLVETTATTWGWDLQSGGKIVWATLVLDS